jgi:hypothetical protein
MYAGDRHLTEAEGRPEAARSHGNDPPPLSSDRRVYVPPALSSYGTVRDITRGDTGGDPEPLLGTTAGGT